MNHLITYDEATGFIKNPPLLAPRPNFTKMWALCKHITQALKLLECPHSMLHRWAGLTNDPTMYALLDPTPFFAPLDQEKSQLTRLLPPRQQSRPSITFTKMQKITSCCMWISHACCWGCSMRTSITASRFPITQHSPDETPRWASS